MSRATAWRIRAKAKRQMAARINKSSGNPPPVVYCDPFLPKGYETPKEARR